MLNSARSGIGEVQKQREEDLLLHVLSVLNDCLTFHDIPEVIMSSYTMIIVLVSKGNWDDKILDSLMEAVILSRGEETTELCLVCLSVIAEERQSLRFPKRVSKGLLKIHRLAPYLDAITQNCRVGRFALGCALMTSDSLKAYNKQVEVPLLEHILFSGYLQDSHVLPIIQEILSALRDYNPQSQNYMSGETRASLATLLTRLNESETMSLLFRQAIEKEGVDIEKIELSLDTTLSAPLQPLLSAPEDDHEMDGVISTEQTNINTLLEPLKSRRLDIDSYLSCSIAEIKDFYNAFVVASSSEEDRIKFLELPSIGKSDAYSSIMFGSFFLRFICSPFSASSRASALHILNDWIKGAQGQSVDLQAALPYLVCSLADRSAKIRKLAASCCRNLVPIYAKGSASKVWGESILYGPSTNVQWLKKDDCQKFLNVILVQSLEECVLDPNHIASVIHTSISESKHSDGNPKAALKSNLRAALCGFLSSHAVGSPILIVRLRLILLMSTIGKPASGSRTSYLLPATKEWFSKPLSDVKMVCDTEHIQVTHADQTHMAVVQAKDIESLEFLLAVITGEYNGDVSRVVPAALDRLKTIWPSIKAAGHQGLSEALLEQALVSSSDGITGTRQESALVTLQSLQLPGDVLVSFVESLPSALQMPDQPPTAKRRRTSRAEMARVEINDSEEVSQTLRRFTLVLELVEGSNPGSHPQLLRGLFYVLAELQHYKLQTNSNLVYLQSMVLSSLLSIIESLKDNINSEVDKSVIRADVLVDCIRNSGSVQIQNAALLLISSLATWVPEIVLHSVMPIFTFMSSTLLKQNDDYSAHIIDQTVASVIPPLAASLRRKDRDIILGVSELLLSFVAAFEHIPPHRRLGLFTQLIKTLGPEDGLYAVMAMLVDKYPTDSGIHAFLEKLVLQFDSTLIINTCTQYLNLVEDAFQPEHKLAQALLSINEKSDVQVSRSLINLVSSLATLLHSQHLRHRLNKALRGQQAHVVRSSYTTLLEKSIHILHATSQREALQRAATDVLSNTLTLLPITELIQSVDTLLGNESADVRRIALKALEIHVSSLKSVSTSESSALLQFVSRIGAVIEQYSDVTLKYTAVTCIDSITEKYGKKNRTDVIPAAEAVAGPHALGHSDPQLRILSLLCLASMVEVLDTEFISLLPRVLQPAITYLDSNDSSSEKTQSVQNAVYALLCALVEKIPYMLSGEYLGKVVNISHRIAQSAARSATEDNRTQFYYLLARYAQAKDCFNVTDQTWDHAISCGYQALNEQVQMLGDAISARPSSDILKNTQPLFNTFLKAFDTRRVLYAKKSDESFSDETLIVLENSITEAAIKMTMKLNDATFRPFFVRLSEWTSKGVTKKDATERRLRSISVYHFLESLFAKLQSIITSYSSYFLEDAASILSSITMKDQTAEELIKAVLGALTQSFKSDFNNFWRSPSHFASIATPLITQLTSSSTDVSTAASTAITALAQAASSTENHKAMNTQILKLFRADEPRTRLAAVKCQQALTETLAEEWLSLLPEMLPFISEAQEDDDEEVEKEIGVWISHIETTLGESLEGMLQ